MTEFKCFPYFIFEVEYFKKKQVLQM